ncbi:hypothetical protein FUAX_23660 [Fulvitalea axinellae]|uniref:LamG-like jellyroll fold domain-containing protein n=1 Tax=Fulvitalea axinellae TaxID=1182444 RepID=A0AAU9D5Z9_9BACT|nr:hypothetical protein FUAX_23660 [Fulvitalea axinellae]
MRIFTITALFVFCHLVSFADPVNKENATDQAIGKCYELKQPGDAVDMGTVGFENEFHLSFWIKAGSIDGYIPNIFFFEDLFIFGLNQRDRNFRIFSFNRNYMPTFRNTAIREHSWQHLIVCYAKDSLTLFQNGIKKGSLHYPLPKSNRSRLKFGGYYESGFYKWKIAKPMFVAEAITDEQAYALYSKTKLKHDLKRGLSFFSGRDKDGFTKAFGAEVANKLWEASGDGKSGYLNIPRDNKVFPKISNVRSGNSGTVCLWVLPVTEQDSVKKTYSRGALFNIDNAFRISLVNQRSLSFIPFASGNTTHTSRLPISKNYPSHFAITFSEHGNATFYFNGILVTRAPIGIFTPFPKAEVEIGTDYWEFDFEGKIYDVGYWTRELSKREIFELYSYPEASTDLLQEEAKVTTNETSTHVVITVILIMLILVIAYWSNRLTNNKQKKNRAKKSDVTPKTKRPAKRQESGHKHKIKLLGPLEVLNSEQENAVTNMPPKLKEIFAFILLRSIENRPVRTAELHDIFWPNYSHQKSKNNRSVSIRRIRETLENSPYVKLVYDRAGLWTVICDDYETCDFAELRELIRNGNPEYLKLITGILERGKFFPSEKYQSLRPFRLELNELLRHCFETLKKSTSQLDQKERARLLEAMLLHDPGFKACEEALNAVS